MSKDKQDEGRREVLKLAAGAVLGAGAMPPAIAEALAAPSPAHRRTGTIQDVEHVVILMQENRSFDHYFGALRGVRGFGDPRPVKLPSGKSVWEQPTKTGGGVVSPFRLDTATTGAQTILSLDHSWKGSHAKWMRHDAWIAAKGPMTMGYFTRADIPFYHALADAFTVCDGYHASIFGPTVPNRLFLFTGTSGLAAGNDSKVVIDNPEELNERADPARDNPKFKGLEWPTYAERLQAAGVSWKLYQEYDNFGDNALAFFANYRDIGPDSPLYQRGRAWSPGSGPTNYKASRGEYLVDQFAADVKAGTLPQVSWIVAPYFLSEHPEASPAQGEYLTARLIAALAANPEVWSKTVFILNYDENDGFFDHIPPNIPTAGPALGRSTVEAKDEVYHGEPVGYGPRVPMIVVSPWTKGGWVNSQRFDHTSVLRFLETRFGVEEPHISPWRRAVSGDLTSVFDFTGTSAAPVKALPDASGLPAIAEAGRKRPWPKPPKTPEPMPHQEAGVRPARALPYAFEVASMAKADAVRLTIANTGAAGAAFNLYPAGHGEPRFYTVEAGKSVDDDLPLDADGYHVELHGPNGFLRTLSGPAGKTGPEARARFDPKRGRLEIALRNDGPTPVTLELAMVDYLRDAPRRRVVKPGAEVVETVDLGPSHHWYDVSITCLELPGFERRFAGHGEDGRPSISDPALGRQA